MPIYSVNNITNILRKVQYSIEQADNFVECKQIEFNEFANIIFFLDLLKEVESSLRTNREGSDSMSKQTRLPTKPLPKEDKTKNNTSKGKEPISPKTPMLS